MPILDQEQVPLGGLGLVPIDVQRGFDHDRWGERNNPDVERHLATLLASFRDADLPVVHVRHVSTEGDSPLRPDRPGNAFKPAAEPPVTSRSSRRRSTPPSSGGTSRRGSARPA